MKQTTKVARSTALRRPLAVLVSAAGLVVAGCANPAEAPSAPSPPVVTSAPQADPQAATLQWARSMCQSLDPAFDQLGAPPELDLGNLAATRQAYIDYLTNARNAAAQANEQLSSVGAPPVDNGQEVFDNMRNQLTQVREDLDEALAQLNRSDPNDVAAIGLALGSAGNVLGALGNRTQMLSDLAIEPQLRTAINQTPECQNVAGVGGTTGTNPPGSPQPPG
ncbi:MAG TPA: hypothetical protein VE645_06195 [Pseudonocardiaceae bacterium]|nr:hypothetical protein [Pseudonocardiaceae bacterium]